ncbi:sugar phosphate isomerase/epimerase family protein [Pseudomonas sp. NPDC089534]|uniref:sugar phosphate isomerase/epimerase family protein n=1 Tax=Pseudomonas sp. NPDC089534 TaxID=3364468 RepID=UPI003818B5CF
MRFADQMAAGAPRIALADWRLPFCAAEAMAFTAWCGLHEIQIDFGGPGRAPPLDTPQALNAVREAGRRHAVSVRALACNRMNDLGLHSPAGTAAGRAVRDQVQSALDAAVYLGAEMVFFPSFRNSLIRDRQTLEDTARLLRWACEQGAQRGLLVANENDLDAPAAQTLVTLVDHPGLRLILDTWNPLKAGVQPLTLIEQLHPVLSDQVHIKDGRRDLEASVPLGLGDGSVAETVQALQRHCTVETYVLENDYRCGDPAHLQHDLAWLLNALR